MQGLPACRRGSQKRVCGGACRAEASTRMSPTKRARGRGTAPRPLARELVHRPSPECDRPGAHPRRCPLSVPRPVPRADAHVAPLWAADGPRGPPGCITGDGVRAIPCGPRWPQPTLRSGRGAGCPRRRARSAPRLPSRRASGHRRGSGTRPNHACLECELVRIPPPARRRPGSSRSSAAPFLVAQCEDRAGDVL